MWFVYIDQYSSVLKDHIVSKTSKLYSFYPKHLLLPYLSITMHLRWHDVICWLLCGTLLHSNCLHNCAFWLANLVCNYWRLLCYKPLWLCDSGLTALLRMAILMHYNACYVISADIASRFCWPSHIYDCTWEKLASIYTQQQDTLSPSNNSYTH